MRLHDRFIRWPRNWRHRRRGLFVSPAAIRFVKIMGGNALTVPFVRSIKTGRYIPLAQQRAEGAVVRFHAKGWSIPALAQHSISTYSICLPLSTIGNFPYPEPMQHHSYAMKLSHRTMQIPEPEPDKKGIEKRFPLSFIRKRLLTTRGLVLACVIFPIT